MILKNNTIAFHEWQEMTSRKVSSLLIKPVGSVCNLRCKYCYYLDKSTLYEYHQPKMDDNLLELFVKQYIDANDVSEITFNWHGGEPLLAGLDFYRKAINLQQKYANGKLIHNTLQTNGTSLSDDWAQFFKDNGFLIGVSIDGPKAIHDGFRKANGGAETWEKVVRGIECLYRNNVEYNTLSTINHLSENQGLNVYQFLKQCGSNYMQFLPVVEYINKSTNRITSPNDEDAEPTDWSISDDGFGRFMCNIFDYWVKHDVGSYFVQFFDVTLANYAHLPSGFCAFNETCGNNAVVEHNGDVYLCDHFVYQSHKVGNIKEKPLREILSDEQFFTFGIEKRKQLPKQCLKCDYNFACHGGCPKHRFARSKDGEPYLNSLCAGYKAFFEHTEPYMKFMLNELKNNGSPAKVMQFNP